MPVRLVTQEDIDNDPDLLKQGVSVNQYRDFPDEALKIPPRKPAAKSTTKDSKAVPEKAKEATKGK